MEVKLLLILVVVQNQRSAADTLSALSMYGTVLRFRERSLPELLLLLAQLVFSAFVESAKKCLRL